jgi:hypothetical protein
MPSPAPENSIVATTTTNTVKRMRDDPDTESIPVKCRKTDNSDAESDDDGAESDDDGAESDDDGAESDDDDEEVDIFSEESMKMLATLVPSCQGCNGFCICGPCNRKYTPTLKYTDSRETVDPENPPLCKRNEDTCGSDCLSFGMFPCVVCKRMDDNDEEVKEWENDSGAREDLVCEYDCCAGCLANIVSEVCPVCKTNNDI